MLENQPLLKFKNMRPYFLTFFDWTYSSAKKCKYSYILHAHYTTFGLFLRNGAFNQKISSTSALNRINYGQIKVNKPKKVDLKKNLIVAYNYVFTNLIKFAYLGERCPVKKLHRFAQSEI